MASTQEDLARLLVSIELSQAKTEKQAAAIAKAAERAAKNIDSSFSQANDNVAKSFQRGAKAAEVSVGQTRAAVTNLTYQLNDIAQGLASGVSPFTVMTQQGSQVAQALAMTGGGAGGAVKALGGAFLGMLNPVSLASFALIAGVGYALQYFESISGGGEKSAETLAKEVELLDKVAQKWGDALPAVKAYAEARKRALDAGDVKAATELKIADDLAPAKAEAAELKAEIADVASQLATAGEQSNKIAAIQRAFADLAAAIDAGNDSTKQSKTLIDVLVSSGNPKAKELADTIRGLASEWAAVGKNAEEARIQQDKALNPLEEDRATRFHPGPLLPDQAPAPGERPSFEDIGQAAASIDSAVKSFVDHVVQAESGGNANAKNPNSSATGVGQFIESTWLDLFRKYYPEQAAGMSRDAILELRKNADVSYALIQKYAAENAKVLQDAGVTVNETALQLAHFLGAGDAAKVLSAASGTPLAGLISAASIKANPTILGGGRTVDDAIAYAERRASGRTGSSTAKTPTDIFAGNLADVQKRIDLLNAEYEAQSKLNPAINDYGFALEKARIKQQLLADAQRAGLEVTPELAAKIDTLAGNYAKASAASGQLKASQQQLAESMQQANAFGKDILGGFIKDLESGKSATEALADALNKVADKLIDIGLNALFPSSGKGGILGGLFSLFGFDDGGYTGPGGKKQPAGIVHKGEVVWSQDDIQRAGGVSAVEAMRLGKRAGLSAPNPARGGGGDMRITVGVSADSNGNLLPFVQSVTKDGIRQAAPSIVQASVQQGQKATRKAMPGMLAEAQSRSL